MAWVSDSERPVVFDMFAANVLLGLAYAASAVSVLPNDGVYGSVTTSLIISGWVFGLALVMSFTGAIVVRLGDRKSTRLNSSHYSRSRMPYSA